MENTNWYKDKAKDQKLPEDDLSEISGVKRAGSNLSIARDRIKERRERLEDLIGVHK